MDIRAPQRRPQPRQTLVSAASRQKPGFRAQPQIVQEQLEHEHHPEPSFGETLAPRVYAWSTSELDYRPRGSDIEINSRSGISNRSLDADSKQEEFGPQALVSLCDGYCGPILEYLIDNMKARSVSRQIKAERSEQGEARVRSKEERDNELQQRMRRCQNTVLAITKKRQEIAEMKERIKQQRQLTSLKKIHLQQCIQRKNIIQEYRLMFQRSETIDHSNNSGSTLHSKPVVAKQSLQVILPNALEEISKLAKEFIVENKPTLVATRSNNAVQTLIKQLDPSNLQLLLETIKESKLNSLSQSGLQDPSTLTENHADSEATELLKLFREHHSERVAQIDSVMNRIAVCEKEKEQLYTGMRARAHRRELEKKSDGIPQELEEAKAQLRGLGAALDFIQTEQEIMVERVVSVDEQKEKLEAMSKTSRSMDQRMTQKQQSIQRVLELIRSNLETVPALAKEVSHSIHEDIEGGLRQLSTLVHDRTSAMENDWKSLQRLTTERQRLHSLNRAAALQPPAVDESKVKELLQNSGADCGQVGGVAVEGQLSLDTHVLSVAGLQRHNLVQSSVVSKAQELNRDMVKVKAAIAESIHLSAQDFEQSLAFQAVIGSRSKNERSQAQITAMQVESLVSPFEGGIRKTVDTLVDFDTTYHARLKDDILNLTDETNTGFREAQEVAVLLKDKETIEAVRSRSDQTPTQSSASSAGRKRVRYGE
ncbi:hypothetical protein BGZ83_004503 [Gryganskiella cystojenkinii]|nr:hypothetical protein BGZ83_004503 [Gryganskiella cystojenkinii]